jgi:hypothetical protein
MNRVTIQIGTITITAEQDDNGAVHVSQAPTQTPAANAQAVSAAVSHSRLRDGCQAFGALVAEWAVRFGDENPEGQPPRKILMERAAENDGPAIIAYVRSRGGLCAATREVLIPAEYETVAAHHARANAIAGNMASVGSFVWQPLRESHEFHCDLEEVRKLPMGR